MALETAQRRATRHGVPRAVAHARTYWLDSVASREIRARQPARTARTSGFGTNRYDSARRPYRPDRALAVCSSPAHSRGAVVQQPARAVPLFEISTTRGRARQVFGVGPGASDRVAWPGVRRHGTWAVATVISAGAPRRVDAIFASLLITPAFSFCLGSVSKIWPPTFSPAWQRESPKTGSRCTGIRFISWRPSWIPSGSGEPVTEPPTGSCLVRRRDAASNPTAMYRTDRSRRFWGIH